MGAQANHLPFMALQRAYESVARVLVRAGWRRERHWFYEPGGGTTPYPLERAIDRELTARYLREAAPRRRGS